MADDKKAPLPSTDKILNFLPSDQSLRYNVFIKRWEYRAEVLIPGGTDEDGMPYPARLEIHGDWHICHENTLTCPYLSQVRGALRNHLNPEVADIISRTEWVDSLQIVRHLRSYDPTGELVDFETITEHDTLPEKTEWYQYLPWISVFQRAYLDNPPEQPMAYFPERPSFIPSEAIRMVDHLVEYHDITGAGTRGVRALYVSANRDKAKTHICYSTGPAPASPYLVHASPESEPWRTAQLIFEAEPYWVCESMEAMPDQQSGTIPELMESILEVGHRCTISEMLALVLHDDIGMAKQISLDYASGDKKTAADTIANSLRRDHRWIQKMVRRDGTRRMRWINPEIEDGDEYDDNDYE